MSDLFLQNRDDSNSKIASNGRNISKKQQHEYWQKKGRHQQHEFRDRTNVRTSKAVGEAATAKTPATAGIPEI
jgi:hypothetical protein